MTETWTVDRVEDAVDGILKRWQAADRPGLIRVEGHSGVGKSTLARPLVAAIAGSYLHLDDYFDKLPRGVRTYLQKLDLVRVHRRFDELHRVGRPIVADGLCLSEALPCPPFPRGFVVYVELEQDPIFAANEVRRRRTMGSDAYHEQFSPRESAEVVVSWKQNLK